MTPTQRALEWAVAGYLGTPTRRLVLLTIALNAEVGAEAHQVQCDLSAEQLADRCEMTPANARRALRELEDGGAIRVIRRGGRTPNRIVIRYDRHPVDLTTQGPA